ncbi:ead/Ea22-like family protein [Klebsiella pneumoniae]|uniref:ead/Ea22-like family protein n=1 Tax=Klebsiella pneumoniae TaxID=573 RepID=UPI0013EF55EE|nr:ead/Ea22-like family protein [Klebsiella pneumoniae]QII53706.1 ead/Ea22-like family protein [Klebsiella pneumoniae]
MTDITELAQSLKAAAEKYKSVWGIARYSKAVEAREKFHELVTPANVIALVEALEKAQQERENWRTSFDNERFRADKLKAYIDDMEPIRAAAEKLVRCKGRYHSEQNYRALAALFGVKTPDLPPLERENVHYADAAEMEIAALRQRIAELESRTVTIEPFRAFVTDADLAALHRFAECCDDPESGGHDLEKEQVRRLESIDALQRSGRISYITGFGDFLISITAGIKWEAE